MEDLINILTAIEHNESCAVCKLPHPVAKLPLHLPQDLQYYFENYAEISLFDDADCPIKVVGLAEFKRANPIIAGEDAADDVSHNWFIIAHDNHSQYITIDLSKDKLGYCYDSFWDRHGVAGEQAVVAKSLTELLQCLYLAKGQSLYWTEQGFQSLGDAYDD